MEVGVRTRCVVYVRVSTAQQALGSGLVRQLEACTEFARSNGLNISGIYGDVGSGDGPMPNRQLAYIASIQMRCPVLVESRDRWSRMKHGTDPFCNATVIVTSDQSMAFESACKRIIEGEIRRLTCISSATAESGGA